MPSSLRSCLAFLTGALLLLQPLFACNTPLSDQAVREAYFLGQHNDEGTAKFLESYRRHFPMPKSGQYISEVEFFTPYAETVDLSRQRSLGYSAQQATQEYHDRGDVFRLRVRVFFTDTYSQRTYAQEATQKASRNSKRQQDARRSSGCWQGFTVQLWQNDRLIEPLELPVIPVFRGYTVGGAYYGFDVVLHYDGEDLASAEAQVLILTPDGQRVTVPFDLSRLL